jgi:nucleoside-diphosphate-sugar epimerase
VGKRCTEILLSRGRTVVATDLRTDTVVATVEGLVRGAHPGALTTVYADLLEAAAISDLVAEHEPSAIIHLAGMLSPPSYRNPRLARRVNVEGTTNLVRAAESLSVPPLLVFASSAAVYGSRNPYRYPDRITAQTPVNPIDQYGEGKVLAEAVIQRSALPYALLRLGGVVAPDGAANLNIDYLLLMRATPGDNRLHTVNARDVALAFANAVDRADTINGKALVIAGDETHVHVHRDVEDDMFDAVGIGRLGPKASLPGDPEDGRGWAFTGCSTPPNLRLCSITTAMTGHKRLRGSLSPKADPFACCCTHWVPCFGRSCVWLWLPSAGSSDADPMPTRGLSSPPSTDPRSWRSATKHHGSEQHQRSNSSEKSGGLLRTFRSEDVDRPHGRQHQQRDLAASRLLIGEVRRVQVSHIGPHLMSFLVFWFPPRGLERLGRDLHTDRVALQDIQVPLRMRVGAAFRCDDHDLATDVAVDERPDIDLRRLATHTLDQAVRGQRTAPLRTHVHDVAPRATGGQIDLEVLADPVTSRRSDRRGIGVAHG